VLDLAGSQSPSFRHFTRRIWISVLGILVVLPMIAAVAVFLTVERRLTATTVYRDSLEIAEASQEVQHVLGNGIKAKWPPLGFNIHFRNTDFAQWVVDLQGPRGTGRLYGVANRVYGWWEYSRLVFVADDGKTKIDLNKSPRRLPLPTVAAQNVYLIPLGLAGVESLDWAPSYYKAKFGIHVTVLPPAQWDPKLQDEKRHQLDAVRVIDSLTHSYPDVARDPFSILIAVTSQDMYTSYFSWRYVENWRTEGRFAVVSSARLHPPSLMAKWNPEWLNSRLQKVLTKNIAILYFDLPLSDDYSSLLSGGIASGLEIDQMSGQIIGVGHSWISSLNSGAPGFTIYDAQGKPALARRAYLTREVVETVAQTFSTDLSSGLFIQRNADFSLDEVYPFEFVRAYTTNDNRSRAFGIGADHSLNLFLVGQMGFAVDLCFEDGGRIHFVHQRPLAGQPDTYVEPGEGSGPFTGAKAEFDSKVWKITTNDGWTYFFPWRPKSLPQYATVLTNFTDPAGHLYKMDRDEFGVLLSITTPSGKWLHFENDKQHRVLRIDSSLGRTVHYEYDQAGRLNRVSDSSGTVTTYTYDEKSQMTTVAHNSGTPILVDTFTNDGYIESETVADAGKFEFSYFRSSRNVTTEAAITDPHGILTSFMLGPDGYTQSLPAPAPR
jgi:YD repeat-containing protein